MTRHARALSVLHCLVLAMLCGQLAARPDAPAPEVSHIEQSLRRATARLERGDVFLAMPLYRELYESLRDQEHAMGRAIAEGLAICEIARGEAPAAVGPWLDALRLRELEHAVLSSDRLPPLIDAQTGLAPLLAPLWLAGPELASLVDDAFRRRYTLDDAGQSPELMMLARLYRQAAQYELDLPGDAPDEPAVASADEATSDSGGRSLATAIDLVNTIVQARAGAADARAKARDRLSAALSAELASTPGSWREAWLRAGLGRSLLRESDDQSRTLGMLELMHLPARFAEVQPRLAALALAEVAREMARRGRLPESDALMALLRGPLADPDALRWLRAPERARETPDSIGETITPSDKETPRP